MKKIVQVKFEMMGKVKGSRKESERGVKVGENEMGQWEKGGNREKMELVQTKG